jgi:predicted RNase H-like HicB family nuclease
MNEHDSYTIAIRHDVFEGEACFEARVRELPDLVEYGDSYEEAYALAKDGIETTAAVFREKNKAMPPAIRLPDDYSGRVTLRVSKTLHRHLAMQADDECISLNQHIVNALSFYTGFSQGKKEPTTEAWSVIVHSTAPIPRKTRKSIDVPLYAVG